MAIAFDFANSGVVNATPGGSSLTFNHTCAGSNRILFLHTICSTSQAPISATYNGVSMTSLSAFDNAGYHNEMFYLAGPATGSHNIVVSLTGSGLILACSSSYTGASQTGIPDAGPQTDINTTPSCTVTTSAANAWMIVGIGDGGASHYNNGNFTNWTLESETVDGSGFGKIAIGDTGVIASPGATTVSSAAPDWMIAASFAPVSGGTTYPSAIINNPVRG